MKPKPKCFGTQHPYIFKCHEWFWKDPSKDCGMVEECYQEYINVTLKHAERRTKMSYIRLKIEDNRGNPVEISDLTDNGRDLIRSDCRRILDEIAEAERIEFWKDGEEEKQDEDNPR